MNMSDEQIKTIVDSQGKTFTRTKDNKWKELLRNHVWDILGMGLTTCNATVGAINFVASKSFAVSCADFYGVDSRYFSETGLFTDKLIVFVVSIFVLMCPFIFTYLNKNEKSKIYVVTTFVVTVSILFMQNAIFLIDIIESVSWDWIKKCIDNYWTVAILLVADIIISYSVIIRKYFCGNKPYKKFEKVLFVIAVAIYISNVSTGIMVKMNYEINDKKTYEVIGHDKVMISSFDDKFVVMNCEIEDDILVLKKGKYDLIDMRGVSITYREYKDVICE